MGKTKRQAGPTVQDVVHTSQIKYNQIQAPIIQNASGGYKITQQCRGTQKN